MGLADVRALRQQRGRSDAVRRRRSPPPTHAFDALEAPARDDVARAGHRRRRASATKRTLHLKYEGTDTTLEIRASPTPRRDRRRVRAPLPAAVRLPDAGQAARDRGGRRRGDRADAQDVHGRRARRSRRATAARADRDESRSTRTARSATPQVYDRERPAAGRRDRRPRGDPRGQRDDRRSSRAGARRSRSAAITRARAGRSGAARRMRSAPPPIRCCSRCSTTCSWRSPSRWA